MNISYNWLKKFIDFDLSPLELADALTSIGLEVGGVEEIQAIKGGLEGLVIGEVLTCEPHPNSDHMHVTNVNLGTGEPVQIVCGAPNVAAGQKVIVATIGTKLYDGDDCFTIKGVTVKESPEWLQNDLRMIGLRPINNIVDITNYILFAYGHPMHCFDADKIKGNQVIVKCMPEGTPFVTLDGVERKLSSRDLMICNAEEPMCIGGVFGGLESGTTEETKNVFLESAYFHPTWIRKTARRHGLSTDASFRYERGIDPNNTIYILKLAAMMVKELAGGEISSEIKDVSCKDFPPFRVELTYQRVNELIGKNIPVEAVKSIVKSLEMDIVAETAEGLTLDVPQYRVDVQRDCDVIEDILRIYGYNNVEIPTTLKSSLVAETETDKSNKLQNLVAEQLVGAGFNEIMNNSLTKAAYYDDLTSYPAKNLVRLMNPLSSDLNVMRESLLFGGLETIARNANHKNPDLKLFEFGNCYYYREEKRNEEKALAPYSESYHLALWLTGKDKQGSWIHADEDNNVYMLKAYVENILGRVGLHMRDLTIENLSTDIYASAVVIKTQGGKRLAMIGTVTRKLLKQFDIDNAVYFADINWIEVMRSIRSLKVSFKELPKFPAVRRDLALLVEKNVQFAQIEKLVFDADRKLVKSVNLFDVYEGKHLEAGKKSYAISITLQDENQTLNDKVIDKVMQKIIKSLEERAGARLR